MPDQVKTSKSQCCVCGKWFPSFQFLGDDLCFDHREPQVTINRIAEQQRTTIADWRRKLESK